jgi:hypothetical protein
MLNKINNLFVTLKISFIIIKFKLNIVGENGIFFYLQSLIITFSNSSLLGEGALFI